MWSMVGHVECLKNDARAVVYLVAAQYVAAAKIKSGSALMESSRMAAGSQRVMIHSCISRKED